MLRLLPCYCVTRVTRLAGDISDIHGLEHQKPPDISDIAESPGITRVTRPSDTNVCKPRWRI